MVPECRHIKTSGGKCGSPALRGQPYCYFHSRLKQRTAESNFFRTTPLSKDLANLEDRGAIQHAITHVAMAAADRQIDAKLAGILLYALQIASGNAKNAEQIVSADSIEEVTRTEQGEEMALEGAVAGESSEPPQDSLAGMLLAEVRKQAQVNRELNEDRTSQDNENKELTEKYPGEGGAPANEYESRGETLDEFGHPKPQWT